MADDQLPDEITAYLRDRAAADDRSASPVTHTDVLERVAGPVVVRAEPARGHRAVAAIAAAALVVVAIGAVVALRASSDDGPRAAVVAGAPEPGVAHVTGRYVGPSYFMLATTGCPQIHTLWDATFDLATGDTWQFHNDYCGTLEGNLFSGSGPFSFTLANGDTITGRSQTTDVAVPGPGGPTELTITGGTGAFAGATGSCALDNHIENYEFGHQQQSGSFTCDITVPASTTPVPSTTSTTVPTSTTGTTSTTSTTSTTPAG
jgi:hypothetical protein